MMRPLVYTVLTFRNNWSPTDGRILLNRDAMSYLIKEIMKKKEIKGNQTVCVLYTVAYGVGTTK